MAFRQRSPHPAHPAPFPTAGIWSPRHTRPWAILQWLPGLLGIGLWSMALLSCTTLTPPKIEAYKRAHDLPALTAALQDRRPAIRIRTVQALGELRDAQTVPALLMTLKDAEPSVRLAGLEALQSSKAPDATSAFMTALAQRPLPVQDARIVPLLLEALRAPAPAVRSVAARALGTRRDTTALDALCTALHDDTAVVRQDAARALGAFRGTRAGDCITTVLRQEHDRAAQATMRESLGRLGRPLPEEQEQTSRKHLPFFPPVFIIERR